MAMEFRSAHVSIPTDLATKTVSLNLHSDAGAEGTILAALVMDEDRAVEIATLILHAATALRGARLDDEEVGQGIVVPPAPLESRTPSPCYCDYAFHPGGH